MRKKKSIFISPKKALFPIVGIGGSAGGLEAFEELLKNIPDNPGMAFVFIMHLAPGHKSLLAELLARKTKMPVCEIKSGMAVEVDHVYVKPANANLSLDRRRLVLNAMGDEKVKRMPIDYFFNSLAEEAGSRSIGVILSGTATDGTLGAEAIKAEGGITFAEDEKSAAFSEMPKSAINAGCVDFVFSLKRIAAELGRIAKHPLVSIIEPLKTNDLIVADENSFKSIFDILRRAKGIDFTYYKTATVSRRILRRIILTKQGNLKNYIKLLREDKFETGYLYEDLLINVTSFFRDPKAFYALEKVVIPKILKNKTKNQGVRVWVTGCSGGEEAYSIAMLLTEALGRRIGVVPVQIFATDVSESSINKARRGVYGPSVKDAISPVRLKRFFTKEGSNYKISKSLRELCVFSRQNVFNDPPFSNVDLIVCRNLLIYLQASIQKKIFHNFHYSLRPGGFLFLGNSESAAGYANLFNSLDKKQKIYVKKYVPMKTGFELGQRYYPPDKFEIKEKADVKLGKDPDIIGLADRIVLDEYAPCGALVNSSMEVVRFHGHTGRYLESAAGRPSLEIFKLVREGLLMPLRQAIYQAKKTKHAAKKEVLNVSYNGRKVSVVITVIPVAFSSSDRKSVIPREEYYLVLFSEISKVSVSQGLPKASKSISSKKEFGERDDYVKSLEKELAETKEYLQIVTEEQGNINEELQTANEEMLSGNEELQSTNEELETAKEELQSSNEELTTTNEELQNRNAEVVLLNNDLLNLFGNINIPVVMLGMDLVIRRVTPQADKVLNVTSADVGRPLDKIRLNMDIPDLEKIISGVIDSLYPKTFEIKDKKGNCYSVYIRPYQTMDNRIDGAVMVFIDITERELARSKVEEARAEVEKKAQEAAIARATAEAESKKATELEKAYKNLRDTQEQLIQAEKLAGLGEFIAGIGHELNSPLTGVLGILRAYIVQKEKESVEYKDLCLAKEACERMAVIIREIVEFAVPSERLNEDLNCNDLLDFVLVLTEKTLKHKNIVLHKDYGLGLPLVRGSKDKLQQVFINIINNACYAMPQGGKLGMATRVINSGSKQCVEIEFSDNGFGIKKEDLRRVFDPFFTTKRPGKGMGLGLSVSYAIVKKHNGDILVDSEPGKGSVFKVRLPIVSV